MKKIYTCIIKGCDYIDNIPGIGMKTAIKLINECNDYDEIYIKAKQLYKDLNIDYKQSFMNVITAFKHQIV